ncbi:MAG: MvdD family ATP-grasp ribosomal peptide maturase [Myxococcales bacterium]|nr:MvdD family ATP-grasp ribosomal peptide maturase [Myxococcales bacterium]
MTVLVITHSRDHDGVAGVLDHVRARGHEVIRLDTDRYPLDAALTIEQGAHADRAWLTLDGATHDLTTVDAIWYRRLRAPRLPPDMPHDLRGVAADEARRVLLGLLNAHPAFALDPWINVRHADHKQRQLAAAAALGLTVPPTLTTNDPAAVRAFAARHPQGIVTKMLSTFALDREGEQHVVFTRALTPDDLDALDSLRLCPMVFQARIDRVRELRCTIVGHNVYCAALDAEASKATADDWRRDTRGLAAAWRPHALPRELEIRLLALASRLGLNYGAADLLVDHDGTHHFLEINPAGEWGWVERAGLPIGEAIAAVLTDPKARRVPGGIA